MYIYYGAGCRLYWPQMSINTGVLRDLVYNLVKKSENTQVVSQISWKCR